MFKRKQVHSEATGRSVGGGGGRGREGREGESDANVCTAIKYAYAYGSGITQREELPQILSGFSNAGERSGHNEAEAPCLPRLCSAQCRVEYSTTLEERGRVLGG